MAELRVCHEPSMLETSALELFARRFPPSSRAMRMNAQRRAWRRALSDNPSTTEALVPRVWVARMGGAPVGLLLGVPFRGRAGTAGFEGHWGVDLFVPESCRGLGIGKALLSRWRDESPLALGLGITDRAFQLETALGWTSLPLPPRLTLALTPRAFFFSRTRPLRHQTRRPGYSRHFHVTSSWHPPSGAASFYDRIRTALPCHISRDSQFLNWRYPGHGTSEPWQFLSLEQRGQVEGLAVFCVKRNRLRCKLWLYELLYHPDDDAVGHSLIGEILVAARAQGADLVEGRMTSNPMRDALCRNGFGATGSGERFIVHAKNSGQGLEELAGHDWYLTLGDSGNL